MTKQNLSGLETKILDCVHYSPHSMTVKPNQALELIAYILEICKKDKLIEAAKDVIARWDSPWRNAIYTAKCIDLLRDAVNDAELASQAQPTPSQSDERAEFEDWLEDFKAQHEDWRYADSEAMYFAAWQARANLSKPQPTPSQRLDEGLLEDWLIKNMPPATVIGDPKWWAKRIRNVLSYENANPSKPQPTSQDVIDAERYRYLINRNSFEVLTGKGRKAGVWIDYESDDNENPLVLLTGIDADDMIDNAMKED